MKSLQRNELDALLAAAKGESEADYLLLLVSFNHGLRVSEAINLTSANIVGGNLVVQRLKGSRKTSQRLLADEREGLERLAKTEGRFFPITRMTAWRRIQRYGAKAGVNPTLCHSHALKHSTGRLGYKGGVGIPELQSYLGHVSGSSTMIYLQADETESANAWAKAVGK